MEIKIFLPPPYTKSILDIQSITRLMGKRMIYASKGRFALLHILRSLNAHGKIMISPYVCASILEPIKMMGLEPVFYDIDIEDLKANIESIDNLYKKTHSEIVLVPSLYGNPANLVEIENYCVNKGIYMVDDAAQSFGAKLDNRMVGSYGNGGFFSLSPGKPAAGHMGAFFWSDNMEYSFQRTNHYLHHLLAYFNFYFNRLNIYRFDKYHIFKIFKYMQYLGEKLFDISNDDMCSFENEILGGIIKSVLDRTYDFRNEYHEVFINQFSDNEHFAVIKAKRGTPNNHKFVLRASSALKAQELMTALRKNNIYSLNGYRLLSNDLEMLENTKKTKGCIVEIPIEDNQEKMRYLFEVLESL